jgi:hypothetical protein
MFKDEKILLAKQKDFHLDNSKEFLTNQTYKIVYEFTGHNNNICKRCKAMEISIKKDDNVYTESYFSDIKKYPLLLEKAQRMVNLTEIGENALVRSSVNAFDNFLKYENNTYKATILYQIKERFC